MAISFSTLSLLTVLPAFSNTAFATPLDPRAGAPVLSITNSQWTALNKSVGGRLQVAYPFAKPCYSYFNGNPIMPDVAACSAVQNGYVDEQSIANNFGGYINTNWATCQRHAQTCSLDFTASQNPTYYAPPVNCYQGSVPTYYISVQKTSDIQSALKFSNTTGVPLVIKNSGHDYKCRSAAPNSLALWMHNVQPPIKLKKGFTPDGCLDPAGDAVTFGAGQGFAGVYEFAEANNITVVGGSSRTIRTVLPNGTYVTANRCHNQELFFALRGGGGSTFGVNWEMTTRAHPQLTLQVLYIRFEATNTSSITQFTRILTQNGDRWASEGWGGYVAPGALSTQISGLILLTPSLSYADAVTPMSTNNLHRLPRQPEKVGLGIALGSRLIPRSLLQTEDGQEALVEAIGKASEMVIPSSSTSNLLADPKALTYGSPFQILVTAPSSYASRNDSAVTPAWYSAAWHIALGQGFANSASAAEIQTAFQTAHDAAQVLRDVAPGSGAYINEADVFEPEPEETYWGLETYQRLLALMKKIDPGNLFTCWGCIGWDSTDARYGCYPSLD
ncbi:hypothetical protein M409DRAFT_57280 [Zasmidium cellare ATCC 36951]|uniref:Berberine/berberine-like domain-containing protein n=1 Tax=Zasmidium cellare ATCC 36951 TaxID=1080233 RepID=A0A6A6CC60_ZASCE|nr:uncharacterized protein M409DRAFT_57280 [Zasmidium cellare ATCC 36951]KAF2163800.1 hypothetical protein M409DRAFT_57280 [Zasmidium cellare ATCC 36951]